MADGQPDPTPKGQTDPASPEVAELKATLAVLTKQLEETKQQVASKTQSHEAATRKMHETLTQLDVLKKEREQASLDLSPEDAAKLLDDPLKLIKYNYEQTLRAVRESERGLDGKLTQFAEEVANAMVERDRTSEAKIRSLDARYQSPAFLKNKEKYKDIMNDEQILQFMKLDDAPSPPPPPAGLREAPARAPVEDHIIAARNAIFADTFKRYPEKK